jgi:hypothetical protein
MTSPEWERGVLKEIGQTRRFLFVPRETSDLSDLTVARLFTAVLLVLGVVIVLVPGAWIWIVAAFLIRLVWVLVLR